MVTSDSFFSNMATSAQFFAEQILCTHGIGFVCAAVVPNFLYQWTAPTGI
jgi:hypothetical protein